MMNILVFRQKRSLAALMLIFLKLEKTKANIDSCSASKSTVQNVENCPTSEQEWMEASRRKNCSAFASQCSEPDKFVYHCVISSSLNGTLEACAYKKVIVFGLCTEYSYSENRIQRSYGAACNNFTENPCPTGYASNEAYKYPGCYELTKKGTTENPTTKTVFTATVSVFQGSGVYSEDKEGIVYIIIGIIVVLLAIVLAVLVYRRVRQKREGPQPLAPDNITSIDEESNQRRAIEEGTSEEKKNLVPSGKRAHTAEKENTIERVDGEETVIPVNPDKEEMGETDCERLVHMLSHGLERLGILQSERRSVDNKEHNLKIRIVVSKIYKDSSGFSDENSTRIHEHIIAVESLERYFRRQKKKENVYLPPE